MKANKQVFMDYDVNMSENITISGLAVRIFLKDFYKNNIPLINKSGIYRDLKEGYYGGITEVYKPIGYNLFYYVTIGKCHLNTYKCSNNSLC
jgi:hypothetical protein